MSYLRKHCILRLGYGAASSKYKQHKITKADKALHNQSSGPLNKKKNIRANLIPWMHSIFSGCPALHHSWETSVFGVFEFVLAWLVAGNLLLKTTRRQHSVGGGGRRHSGERAAIMKQLPAAQDWDSGRDTVKREGEADGQDSKVGEHFSLRRGG